MSRLFSGARWNVAATLVGVPAGLGVVVLAARVLDADAVGRFFTILSLGTLGSVIAVAGLHQTGLRAIARSIAVRDLDGADSVLNQASAMVVIAGLFTTATLVILEVAPGNLPWSESGHDLGLATLLGALILARALVLLHGAALQGLHHYAAASMVSQVLPHLMAVVLLGVMALLETTRLTAAVVAVTTGAVFAAMVGRLRWRTLLRSRHDGAGSINPSAESPDDGAVDELIPKVREVATYQGLLREALPVWAFTVLRYTLTMNVDLLVLAAFRPLNEVAVYGAATRLAQVAGLPANAFNTSSGALVAELDQLDQRTQIEDVTRMAATLGAILVVSVTVTFAVLGPWLLELLFGAAYRSAATVLLVLCVGKSISAGFGQAGTVLLMTGHQVPLVRMTALAATLYLGGSIVGAIAAGGIGVAIASVGALTIQNLGNWLLARRHVGVVTHASLETAVGFMRFRRSGLSGT